GGIRTPNLLIRSQKLYPFELQAQRHFRLPIFDCRSFSLGASAVGNRSKISNQSSKILVGWPTGLEPATTRTTIWGSTIELRPPTVTQNEILRFESPFANPVSVWLSVWTVAFFSFRGGREKGQRRTDF